MKLHGIGGVGTGKLGNMVYSVRNGQQIVRQYNPIVANPSTEKQVEARSKMKLMSQLAAIVAPVIAISADGLKSKRNLFISRNYPLSSYSGESAAIDMENVQLTKSNTAFPDFEADRSNGQSIAIHLSENGATLFDKVIYCAVIRQADGALRLLDSVAVDAAGAGGLFPAVLPYTPNAIVIYGYGIRYNNDLAKAEFGNLKAPTAEMIASILSTRRDILSATTVSETKGLVMEAGENQGQSVADNTALISVSVEGSGSVTGAGRVLIGSQVTLTATPANEATFLGWYGTDNQLLSSELQYQFVAQENLSIKAKFSAGQVTVTATSNNETYGTVSGGGVVTAGTQVTLRATVVGTNQFDGWYVENELISRANPYTFVAENDITFQGRFSYHYIDDQD